MTELQLTAHSARRRHYRRVIKRSRKKPPQFEEQLKTTAKDYRQKLLDSAQRWKRPSERREPDLISTTKRLLEECREHNDAPNKIFFPIRRNIAQPDELLSSWLVRLTMRTRRNYQTLPSVME